MLLNVKHLAKGENFGLRLRRFRFISVSLSIFAGKIQYCSSLISDVVDTSLPLLSVLCSVCLHENFTSSLLSVGQPLSQKKNLNGF